METREGGGGTGKGNKRSGARWRGNERSEKERGKGSEKSQRLKPTALLG